MKILITGASGFVGQALIEELEKKGHDLVLVSRTPSKLSARYGSRYSYVAWDALSAPPGAECFDGVEGIINLMGEGVAEKRWSEAQKQKIYDTRVRGTEYLVAGALAHAKSLKVFVSASAVGIYDHTMDTELTVDSPKSNRFLAKVCQDWEAAAKTISQNTSVRLTCIRIGVVLGDGGALAKMKRPFSLGLGGTLGTGAQWMNWIHVKDLARLLARAVDDESFSGIYNGVAPGNIRNLEFTKTLGRVLKRPTVLAVPAFAIKLLFGDFADELLEGGCVRSLRLCDFEFEYPELDAALSNSLDIEN